MGAASRACCAAIGLAAWASGAPTARAGLAGLQRVASDLAAPMFAAFAPGDASRLFIAERGSPSNSSNATASIRILNLATGVLQSTPFLRITGLNNNGEGGLLGLAFHPNYATNGKFYVYVTASGSGGSFNSHLRQYSRSTTDPNLADSVATPVLSWLQPQTNHNGGWIGFSPLDGYLYVMSGDGGGGNDSGTGHTAGTGNAQDLTANLLGKVLRIDVEGDDFPAATASNYAIPRDQTVDGRFVPGNPFAADAPGGVDPAGDDEIWSYGLRNPFRAGFDRATGDLWIGDVGQSRREEINFQPGSSAGGENYGWRLREGFLQTPSVGGAKPADNVDPIDDYKNVASPDVTAADADFVGRSVVGGVPYRGPDPTLQGVYFFADTSENRIWTLRRTPGGGLPLVEFVSPLLAPNVGFPSQPVAISEDAVGNLYVTYLSGSVYRIRTDAFTPGNFNDDADVDDADLTRWATGFGVAAGATRTAGDADGDGDVDGADLLAYQRHHGWSPLRINAPPATVPVPEPAAAVLPLAGAALCGGRGLQRRGRRAASRGTRRSPTAKPAGAGD